MTQQNHNSFKEVQERHNIVDIAKELGITLHRVGSSLRGNSIAGNGTGTDAFTIYESTNTWHDFMLGIGGDITDLVAYVKYNGDKYQALCELLPDCQNQSVKQSVSLRETFMEEIDADCARLLDTNYALATKPRDYLHSRGISDDTIKKLKIGYTLLGHHIRIRIPFWDVAGKKVLYFITRSLPNEDSKENPRYMKASLDRYPFLRNAPLGLNSVKNSEFCVLTEGAFDWIHLSQLGIPALSPNGTDFGKLWPEVIEVIRAHFKYVVLLFDNDYAGTEATVKAAKRLIKERIPFKVAQIINVKDVAEVCQSGGDIKKVISSAKNGLKWYLNYIMPATEFDALPLDEREIVMDRCKDFIKTLAGYSQYSDIQEIILPLKKYLPREWFSALCSEAKKGLSEFDACQRVIAAHKLVCNEKTGFYEFTKKGVWEKMDDTTVKGYLTYEFGSFATGRKVPSAFRLLKTFEIVNSAKPLNGFNKKCCVAFVNGTLHINLKTRSYEFAPHNSDDNVTVRLPYFYDPDAKCPKWIKFLEKALGGKKLAIRTLQEFVGYILCPDCRFQKALMLKGYGSNGKSVFIAIVKALFGDWHNEDNGYVSYSEPAKFGKDFRLMKLKDSWVNISSDAENNMVGGEGVFKKIVCGEILEDSYKHKDPFSFRSRSKLIMSANFFPNVSDTSHAFLRRWLIVNFSSRFVSKSRFKEGAGLTIADTQLIEKLLKELSGIFNWAVEGLFRLLNQDEFTEPEDHDKLIREFAEANNHVFTFVEDCMYEFNSKKVHRNVIFQRYRYWAEASGSIPMAANRFYSNLKSVLDVFDASVKEEGRFWTVLGEFQAPEKPENTEVDSDTHSDATQSIAKVFYDIINNPNDDRQAITDTIESILLQYFPQQNKGGNTQQ